MLNAQKTSRLYDFWSRFYDQTFERLFVDRQRRAIEELRLRPGQRVLDIGVGTGMTLEHYPADVEVVGMDLSAGMLREASKKAAARSGGSVLLVQGDAMLPPFAPESFDHVLVSHVISVVPDPVRLLEWSARLTRPAGRVVVINHFRSSKPPVAAMERLLNPICMKLGWRSDLILADLIERSPLELAYQFKTKAMDLWQIAVLMHRTTSVRAA